MRADAPAHRRRLLLVDNSLHRTGAFASALALARALRGTCDVEFILSSASTLHNEVAEAGIVCHRLPMIEIGRSWRKLLMYFPMLLLNTFKLRRLLLQRQVDVVVINDYYNLLGACIRLTGWSGRVLTMVRLLPKNQQPVMNKIWTTLGMLFSHHLIAVSRAVERQLPISPKVTLIYNSIVLADIHSFSVSRQGTEDGLVHCLYPANYIVGKGHEAALDAFAIAWRKYPALRLRFVGGDMELEKNRALKAELARKTVQLGLQNVVIVDGFSLDVELDIKNSDIVLNFSKSESFSITCVEACAYGRPIIATRCGGPEEIIQHGVSGLLVPLDDLSAMSTAILELANNVELRNRMGANGVVIVREKFSKKAFLNRFLPLCESVQA